MRRCRYIMDDPTFSAAIIPCNEQLQIYRRNRKGRRGRQNFRDHLTFVRCCDLGRLVVSFPRHRLLYISSLAVSLCGSYTIQIYTRSFRNNCRLIFLYISSAGRVLRTLLGAVCIHHSGCHGLRRGICTHLARVKNVLPWTGARPDMYV